MSKLAETPYEVFYLINNSLNTEGNRSLWDMKEERKGDTVTSTYTKIVAYKDDSDNRFESVIVKATKITDTTTYLQDIGLYQSKSVHEDYPPMKWDDLDPEIVEIINKYYDEHETDYDNPRANYLEYASGIKHLIEDDNSIVLSIDKKGLPRIVIDKLPIVKHGEYDDYVDESLIIESSPFRIGYEYTIGTTDEEEIKVDVNKLFEYMDKARRYDKIRELMKDILGFDDEYYDDFD